MRLHGGPTAAIVLLLALSTAGSGAAAQPPVDPSVDFLVTPSRIEMEAHPGDSFQVAVTVYNRADDQLLLDTYIEDIEVPRSDLIRPDEFAFTASRWLDFDVDQIVLAGGTNTDIVINVEVPEATPSGGYHAFGFVQSQPQPGSNGIQPSGRIGVTLLLEVAPEDTELDRSARVSDSGLEVRWNNLFDPEVVAHTVVDNIGEAHVVTGGVHTFRSWPGSASLEAKIGPYTTLRGTRHTFESSWDAVPLFGKVTVTSELVYQAGPDDLPVIVTQHTVWIIPWHLLGGVLVALVVTGLILKRRKATKQPSSQIAEHDEEEVQSEKQTV